MIVVDIGCKAYGPDDSLGLLVARYDPHVLFGFDPNQQLHEGTERVGYTTVITRQAAAWTYTGLIGWRAEGSRSRVSLQSTKTVQCFRLATFLFTLPPVDVLKIDAEGAEYALIPDLLDAGADEHVGTLLIEWHGDPITTAGRWDVQFWHEPMHGC